MIKLENYRPIDRENGCVIAEIDITIVDWKLRINRILEYKKKGKRWFSYPSFLDDSSGEWLPYAYFVDKNFSDRFLDKLREVVDTRLEKVKG